MEIQRNAGIDYAELKTGLDAKDEYSRRSHSHAELSVGYVDLGSTSVRVKDSAWVLHPGDALCIPPGWVHLCEPDAGVYRFMVLYVKAAWFYGSFGVDARDLLPFKTSLGPAEISSTAAFFRDFSALDSFEFESSLFELLDILLRDTVRPRDAPGKTNIPLERAKAYIDRHFTEEISLDALASLCDTNKYTLIRTYRERYRLTPHAAILDARMKLARELLTSGGSIAAIAAECGFADQSHFDKTFKLYVGIAPSEYRK